MGSCGGKGGVKAAFKNVRGRRTGSCACVRQAAERLSKCAQLLRSAPSAAAGGLEAAEAQLAVVAQAQEHVRRAAAAADEADSATAAKKKAARPAPTRSKGGASAALRPAPFQLDAATLSAPLHSDAWAAVRVSFSGRR